MHCHPWTVSVNALAELAPRRKGSSAGLRQRWAKIFLSFKFFSSGKLCSLGCSASARGKFKSSVHQLPVQCGIGGYNIPCWEAFGVHCSCIIIYQYTVDILGVWQNIILSLTSLDWEQIRPHCGALPLWHQRGGQHEGASPSFCLLHYAWRPWQE